MQTRPQIRKRAGYTLMRLSKRTGISSSRLSLWERHEARLLDAEIADVAAALLEGLSRTPEFSSSDEIEEILIEGDSE
jgi:transcriptional regulator with XRE-family HTH domain